ncbi:hypothetical protein PHYBOEH_005804 [Phytophthora boehmeriae]|uniref:Uncharacterized protein n=1 Tax=Phytophthora boehmeriae TaxID=109152 RepID=A0A8T1X9K8_9STRA|nr:hypothetical protein PHYBOEH_005804 [Phytophthora boehmeriae]
MVKFFSVATLAATAFGVVSAGAPAAKTVANTPVPTVADIPAVTTVADTPAVTTAPDTPAVHTVADTCVLTNFESATADFIALNNLVNVVKTSPALLKQYISDPLFIQNQTLATQNFTFLGNEYTATPTIHGLNVSGITTISPRQVNVTSNNTLDLGTDFTGTISLAGTLSVEIAQPNHKWYEICWVNLLHPVKCEPKTVTVDVALAISKPELVSNVEANLFNCAPGISTAVCQNLTMTSIMTGALNGDLTALGSSVFKNFKDAKVNSLQLGWDAITNIDFAFHESSTFTRQLINGLLDFSVETLNKKKKIYEVFIEVAQKLTLSLGNKLIDSMFEPLFGATCL